MEKRLPGCTGKVPHLTLREAKHALKIAAKHNNGVRTIYKCRYLFFGQVHWHTTSLDNRTAKVINKKRRQREKNRENKSHSPIV